MTQPNPAAPPAAGTQPEGQQPPAAPADGAPPADGQQQQDPPLSPEGQRALEAIKAELKAEREKVKELTPLAQKAREAEEAQKSEVQRAQEAAAQALARAEAAEANALRLKVGSAKNLPPEVAELLKGKDEAEMSAHADTLLAVLGTKQQQAPPPGAGVAGNGGAGSGPDMNSLLRAAVRGTT